MVTECRPHGAAGERGAALLTVLLLVAILSVITAVALERLTLSSRMARNIVSADQARAFAMAAEQVSAVQLGELVKARKDRTTLAGGWLGTPQRLAVPGGSVNAQVRDAGNCFNLNSLVEGNMAEGGSFTARPVAIAQFAGLMRLLGIERAVAEQVAISAADWIDSDTVPGNGGAEDDYYMRFDPPYRAANGLMADPSELRMVNGVSADVYQRVRPWICALPTTDLSPININTLLPQQAVILAMLAPEKLGIEQARQVLAQRPADGYGSLPGFWAQPALVGAGASEEVTQQTRLVSRWFEVTYNVDLGGDEVSEMALFDASRSPARLVRRQRGEGG